MEKYEFLIKISICFLLSILIGLEREKRKKAAGLRTNVLVCIGAFLFVTVSVGLENDYTRMAAQVISGIGFLGAGTIITNESEIRGLNTAATLWCVAAIGVLTSLGLIFEAVVGTIFILLSNVLLRRNNVRADYGYNQYILKMISDNLDDDLFKSKIIDILNNENISIKKIRKKSLNKKPKFEIIIETYNNYNINILINKLANIKDITSIEYNLLEDDDF